MGADGVHGSVSTPGADDERRASGERRVGERRMRQGLFEHRARRDGVLADRRKNRRRRDSSWWRFWR